MATVTVTRTRSNAPDVTVTYDGAYYRATVEITDLDPGRALTATELARGIESIDPSVKVRARTPRGLVDIAVTAVLASAWDTDPTLTPGECATIRVRVAAELRRALKALGAET